MLRNSEIQNEKLIVGKNPPWQQMTYLAFPSSPKEIADIFHMHLEQRHLKIMIVTLNPTLLCYLNKL